MNYGTKGFIKKAKNDLWFNYSLVIKLSILSSIFCTFDCMALFASVIYSILCRPAYVMHCYLSVCVVEVSRGDYDWVE